MTVELICGECEIEDLGSTKRVVAKFVREDDLKTDGFACDISEAIRGADKADIIKALSDRFDPYDIIDIDADLCWSH